MEQFVWLMVLWTALAEWRSVSMECGEQCVTIIDGGIQMITGITILPELYADNWGTVQEEVS